jgi:putative nucleotidyltransferase with HDIG domain
MPDLRDKRVDLILQQLEELPTLSSVAMRVLEVTGNEDSSAREVVQLIESDPTLTTRILKLVNRADLGARGEVSSVERAVVLLGFEAVRSAVLAISVFDAFKSAEPRGSTAFNRDEFWKHSLAVACLAELLAQTAGRAFGVDPSEAFVNGLLHDLGKIAFDAVLPKSFSRVIEAADLLRGNIADVERNIIGLDHMVTGKRLAERWNLPTSIRESIWLHGQTPSALPATVRNAKLINLITLADVLVREQHLGYSGNFLFGVSRESLQTATKLDNEQIELALSQLVDRVESRARVLGLGVEDADALYRQALSQANKELLRANSQLAMKNRKLAVRAKFFEALSQFQGDLRPDAPPQVVLKAIAQTAASVLGVESCAVYSLPPGRDFAECIVVDATGERFDTSLIDIADQRETLAARAYASTPAGPVRASDDSIEWLLNEISPQLSHDQRFYIALDADAATIGGVVWGAAMGESQRLASQVQELTALASGWSLALRTAQIREEARALTEQLAESNRQLQSAQSEILRSRTLISVGEMAAGAAHEMNNPLAVISGRSQLLAQQLVDAKLKSAANLVYEQSQRLSDIITELMDFAKPSPARPAEIDPVDLIHRSVQEAKSRNEVADRNIELSIGESPLVKVDPAQVSAAIGEVIGNAFQATDAKTGQIRVSSAYDSYSQRLVITISDNGEGMDDATLKRAFDPFFSAKRAGRRRGMGLAKALRWVESSGGSIRLESRSGEGTRAIVLLPVTPANVDRACDNLRKKA